MRANNNALCVGRGRVSPGQGSFPRELERTKRTDSSDLVPPVVVVLDLVFAFPRLFNNSICYFNDLLIMIKSASSII